MTPFVLNTNFPLPSVTGPGGAVMDPVTFVPGRCVVRLARFKPQPKMFRKSLPAGRARLGGFWSTLIKGSIGVGVGAGEGFLVGGPAGAVVGGATGAISSVTKGGSKQPAAAPAPVPASPLLGLGTGTIVAIALGFTAFVIVLAKPSVPR